MACELHDWPVAAALARLQFAVCQYRTADNYLSSKNCTAEVPHRNTAELCVCAITNNERLTAMTDGLKGTNAAADTAPSDEGGCGGQEYVSAGVSAIGA